MNIIQAKTIKTCTEVLKHTRAMLIATQPDDLPRLLEPIDDALRELRSAIPPISTPDVDRLMLHLRHSTGDRTETEGLQ